jgi:CBS domain-containing protein
MRVADVMSYGPAVIDAYETVQAAAQAMRSLVVGALPVTDRGRLVGIVTDRDLAIRCVAPGVLPWDTHVREVMTRAPCTCHAGEPLAQAAERMIARRVRRLVVVDGDGAVAGLLALDDVALFDEALGGRVLRGLALLRGELDGILAAPPP